MKSEIQTTIFITVLLIIIACFVSSCDTEDNPVETVNHAPVILAATAGTVTILPDAFSTCVCLAVDEDQDSLAYSWSASSGSFPDGRTSSSVRWLAPDEPDTCSITVTVGDGKVAVQSTFAILVTADGDMGEVEIEIGESGLTLEMIKIEPGEFEMGAEQDSTEYNESDEYPQHTVSINYGYWIGKYEITQDFWEAVLDTNPSFLKAPSHPVENVSWLDVISFIDTLNSFEANSPWRLPSEAEWEYACRAGTSTIFFWGADTQYTEIEKYTVSGSTDYIGAHEEVGNRMPNPWGICDMTGNVWEWCEDKPHASYNGAPDDGSSWEGRGPKRRVLRGGSWADPPQNCRSSERHAAMDSLRFQTVGFRLVRDGL